MEGIRRVRLAAVQMDSRHGDIAANLQRATDLCEQAAAQGAQLALMPELMPGGHQLTSHIWDTGEARDGQTATWLGETAARLGMYLGTGFLEVDGEDFFNTFALAGPDGRILGYVRKQSPALSETYFFAGSASRHVIDTELGKIGVGICNDNHQAYLTRLMFAESADLLLMPHAWPLPLRPARAVSSLDIARQRKVAAGLAVMHGRNLRIPALMVNRRGPCTGPTPPGIVARLLPPSEAYAYPGLSSIADSDGTLVAQLGAEEGVAVAEVTFDATRKATTPPATYGARAYEGASDSAIARLDEAIGRFFYRHSARRRQHALSVPSCRSAIA
jgi:N-carbamoylputrescine amidase